MNGLVVVDKPAGVTSRDAVDAVQRWFPRGAKVGHAGTLDPLATGVLVVAVGAATRLVDRVQAMAKSYAATVRLGATSDTDDADGTVTPTAGAGPVPEDRVRAALAGFVGAISQVPPAYSAVKVAGRRAHDLARRGNGVSLAARPVRVDAVRVVGYAWPLLDLEIDCGKGTYIRSIARDLGAALGVGGLIQTLRRTRIGPFTADQGVGIDVASEVGRATLRPMAEAVAEMPRVDLPAADARRFAHGQAVRVPPTPGGEVAAFGPAGELVGLGSADPTGWLRPILVLK